VAVKLFAFFCFVSDFTLIQSGRKRNGTSPYTILYLMWQET